jgi:hypothetical protein
MRGNGQKYEGMIDTTGQLAKNAFHICASRENPKSLEILRWIENNG